MHTSHIPTTMISKRLTTLTQRGACAPASLRPLRIPSTPLHHRTYASIADKPATKEDTQRLRESFNSLVKDMSGVVKLVRELNLRQARTASRLEAVENLTQKTRNQLEEQIKDVREEVEELGESSKSDHLDDEIKNMKKKMAKLSQQIGEEADKRRFLAAVAFGVAVGVIWGAVFFPRSASEATGAAASTTQSSSTRNAESKASKTPETWEYLKYMWAGGP
jgi:gas vesicle protein